ncbi:hypothetical protein CR194_14390 [Salipaludibacillus keqinensis]|uniref:PDZ domain-containing protein n=1 Tax=Salipaludibacillus keqinensis TaxID=2045207 RepID=A0A323TJJ9_9BACI|nr:PDZ domain-containing protein [Salipaludibacillus keqinensis]PYZ92833.1 hypothetical protein CR194_14390 [Salipaludibacillus keqinensis]
MDVIGFEIFRALGRFFLHPLTYIFILAIFWLGFQRVQRERKDFHTRVYDVIQQVTSPLSIAIIVGLSISIGTVLLGIELPVGMMALLTAVWLLLLPLRHARWLSITVAGSIALIVAPFLPAGGTEFSWLNGWLSDLQQMNLVNLAWLLTILFIAESLLVLADGWKQSSPAIVKSKRGKMVGEHKASRLWFLPVFLLFPMGEWSGNQWWPLFELSSGETFGLALFPFLLGFQARIHSEYPMDGVKKIGKRLLLVNIAVITLAVIAYFYPIVAFFVAAVILLGRELVYFLFTSADQRRTSLFTGREKGLKILGILPHSTANKMELEVGEIIVKANGREVNSQREFYNALQQNSAYCKLEVTDLDGELRFTQSTIFQGDHYQIGCLFVPDDEVGNLSYRALRSSVVIHQDRAELDEGAPEHDDGEIVVLHEETTSLDDGAEESDSYDEDMEPEKELAATEDSSTDEFKETTLETDRVEDAQQEKEAHQSGSPYGQAAGLASFYDEFRQTKIDRNRWTPNSEENSQGKKENE